MDYQKSLQPDDGQSLEEMLAPRGAPPVSATMLEAVTSELIARLTRRLPAPGETAPVQVDDVDPEKFDAFCAALVAEDGDHVLRMFDAMRANGATPDALYIRYFAPAARALGERWMADECSFLEVTLGSARLHGLMRQIRSEFSPVIPSRERGLTSLFSAVPGDTHLLGVTMVSDFFRRAGWSVDLNTSSDPNMLFAKAQRGAPALIGLSAGCRAVIGELERVVKRLKVICPSSKLVLGGYLTELEPGLAGQLGLDAVLTDVTNAPFTCRALVNSALDQ